MQPWMSELAAVLVACLIAGLTYLKTYIDNKRLKERMDSIVDVLHSEDSQYYVKCPKCDNKILLAEVTIYTDKKEK